MAAPHSGTKPKTKRQTKTRVRPSKIPSGGTGIPKPLSDDDSYDDSYDDEQGDCKNDSYVDKTTPSMSLSQHKPRDVWMGDSFSMFGKEVNYNDKDTLGEKDQSDGKCFGCDKLLINTDEKYCPVCLVGFGTLYDELTPDIRWKCELCDGHVKLIDFVMEAGVCTTCVKINLIH